MAKVMAGGRVRAGGATAALEAPGRWRVLALLAVAELMGMSLWFTATAVAPQLQQLWQLTSAQTGWLTTIVQLGFVAGTAAAALLNLADLIPSRSYFAGAALLAASANALLLAAPGFAIALALRFLTGFFLAGVYPPAMKMAATWFRGARGLAIGVIVGALTLGKSMPYLIGALPAVSMRGVVLSASAACVAASVLVGGFYRDGPNAFVRRPFDWRLVRVVTHHRETRLAVLGYLGHMWELYAMWSLVSLFFAHVFELRGASAGAAHASAGVVGFGAIAVGGVGCVIAGAWADRLGRERVAIWSMAVSGCCAAVIGWLVAIPIALLILLALVWGFFVVADSAQFSALVTELAPAHSVGTALTLQTSTGFLLTAFSIWMASTLSASLGWGIAFSLLAIGPALGILAMRALRGARREGGRGEVAASG